MYVSMASSKGVCTRHRISRFLHISVILKIHPNAGQTSGTTAEGKKTHMDKCEGKALLYFETFYFCIESKLENQKITVTHSPCS